MGTDLVIGIKTAGFRHDQDYNWVRWPDTVESDDVMNIISERERFIDDRNLAIILTRIKGDRWLLVVKALQSTRRDFDNTPIRNAIALVGDSTFLPQLVSFASTLLRSPEEIAYRIDACILEDVGSDASGFRVEFPRVDELVRLTPAASLSGHANGVPLIGKYSDPTLWRQMADELVAGSFPMWFQTLVLVSKSCSYEVLRSLEPYRTLSDVAGAAGWQRTDELVHTRSISTSPSLSQDGRAAPQTLSAALWIAVGAIVLSTRSRTVGAVAVAAGVGWWWWRSRK